MRTRERGCLKSPNFCGRPFWRVLKVAAGRTGGGVTLPELETVRTRRYVRASCSRNRRDSHIGGCDVLVILPSPCVTSMTLSRCENATLQGQSTDGPSYPRTKEEEAGRDISPRFSWCSFRYHSCGIGDSPLGSFRGRQKEQAGIAL